MKRFLQHSTLYSAIFSALLLAGCGGSSDSVSVSGAGGDAGGDTGSDAGSESGVSGLVADGYLVGATVCLDINENKVCDPDEPSATTVAGGEYEIDLPDGVDPDQYTVLVEVGENTIDEDTGQPVGKNYVLTAPAGKPAFVSPLTTMVQSRIESNPGMSSDEAEGLVKSDLGTEADLFENFIEAKADDSNEDKEEYERLHKVAQVTARVLADNLEIIELAAAEASLDPVSVLDELVKIVVQEVITQLDVIVASVDESEDESFDPDVVAATVEEIDTSEVDEDVAEQQLISSVVEKSVEEILQGGVNWIFAHPGYTYYDAGTDTNISEPTQIEYGRISLNETSDGLVEDAYEYDYEVSDFVLMSHDRQEIVLGPNGFVSAEDSVENWRPVFNDDNTVTISLSDSNGAVISQETITGSGLDIANKPMSEMLRGELGEVLVDPDALFPDGSVAYRWYFTNAVDLYTIDSWGAGDDHGETCGDGVDAATYNGNCNTAYGYSSGITISYNSYEESSESTHDGSVEGGTGSYHDGGIECASDPYYDSSVDGGTDPYYDSSVDGGVDPYYDSSIGGGTDPYYDSSVDGGVDPYYDSSIAGGADPYYDSSVDGGTDPYYDSSVDGGTDPYYDSSVDGGTDPYHHETCYEAGTEPYYDGGSDTGYTGTQQGPASSFEELLFPLEHVFDNNSRSAIHIGELDDASLAVQLVAGETADAGAVRFVSLPHDHQFGPTLLETGSWSKVLVGDVPVIKFAVPSELRLHSWDSDEMGPEGRVILVVHDGFVRLGSFIPAGTVETEEEWNFNDIAMEALLLNFQAPVSIEPNPSPGPIGIEPQPSP